MFSSSLSSVVVGFSVDTRRATGGGGGGSLGRGLAGGGREFALLGGGGGAWKSGFGTKVDVGADPALALAVARRSLVHVELVCWLVR